jgi:hypothetical protein
MDARLPASLVPSDAGPWHARGLSFAALGLIHIDNLVVI